MGFLDRANEKRAEIASAVSAPTNNSNISFFSFTKKYGLNCCCSFSKKANHFYITNSIGFDGDSILKSYSTDDFWNGAILPEDRIITYTQADTNLNSFKQFFSDTLLFDLESLTILKTSKNTSLFVLNISDKVDTTTLATDF
ncbi:MAG: hypothetical protein MJ162_01975, partial [Treponema sp.]|nr:hypothetical protein [Treponema sp.]